MSPLPHVRLHKDASPLLFTFVRPLEKITREHGQQCYQYTENSQLKQTQTRLPQSLVKIIVWNESCLKLNPDRIEVMLVSRTGNLEEMTEMMVFCFVFWNTGNLGPFWIFSSYWIPK